MKITVVSDSNGKILSLFPLPAEDGKGKLTYVPQPGQQVHVLDVPRAFENKTLFDLHAKLHVQTSDQTVTLVER